jgi:hypothetical protein
MANTITFCTRSKGTITDPCLRPVFFLGETSARHTKYARQTGSVLFTVMILMLAAAVVAASVLNTAINSLRLAQRNDARAQMSAVADSELDWMFFNFMKTVQSGTSMATLGSSSYLSSRADSGATPTTIRDVYLDMHRADGWRVQRSVRHLLSTKGIDSSNGGSRRALLDYVEVKVIVLPPLTGIHASLPPVRIGRYFVASQSSIFQYGVFFDGDLELNPGENYTMNGDLYSSGNAFIAPLSGKTLTIDANAKLRLTGTKTLNGSADPLVAGTTRYNPDAPATGGVTLADPLFSLTGTGAPGAQKEMLTSEENLLGGLDALATAKARPDLFAPSGRLDPIAWTDEDKEIATNNVKRSLIVPPPADASATEYPNTPTAEDDPAISVQRAYTRAGIVVTVSSGGTVTISKKSSSGTLTDVTSAYSSIIPTATPVSVYDAREGRDVKVTELDIAALKTQLASATDFNGLIYVNLKNSTSSAPAAVRIVNGEDVPLTSQGTGLSVATNGGLYVKGSYNSTAKSDGTYPSSMLMADAVTVLSYNWDDANASADVTTSRVASVDNPDTPSATETSIAINAGIVTGNSTSSLTNSSGGAQNLVRYLENWSGKSVSLYGSLGRVFDSTQFSRPFLGTSTVYRAPNRQVSYDATLAASPPTGSPVLTSFSLGDIFRF